MEKEKELLLLIGASGSGKSRYAEHLRNYTIISSDKVRLELFGDLIHQSDDDHEKVFNEVHNRIGEALKTGSVVYDATNLSRKKRRYLYDTILPGLKKKNKIKERVFIKAIVFIEPYSIIKENNDKRPVEQQVPLYDLKKMYMTVQIPRVGVDCDSIEIKGDTDFFSEEMSYTLLSFIESLEELIEYISEPYKEEMKKLFGPHDTPYHLEDISTHINMCIENSDGDDILAITSMFHDLGKAFTKKDGRYLNHQFVSSMYAMKAFSEIPDMPEDTKRAVLEIIYQHMNGHDGLSAKTIKNNNLGNGTVFYIHKFAEIDSKSRITAEI